MNAYADGQGHALFLRQAGIELAHRLHNAQPGSYRPRGVIFMREGIAKVDEQPIAEVLGDMALIAGDHRGAGILIGSHHRAPVFRIELAGEDGGVHQITEQDREMAAFSLWDTRGGLWISALGRWLILWFSHLHWLPTPWGRCWSCACPSGPHQTPPILLNSLLVC